MDAVIKLTFFYCFDLSVRFIFIIYVAGVSVAAARTHHFFIIKLKRFDYYSIWLSDIEF